MPGRWLLLSGAEDRAPSFSPDRSPNLLLAKLLAPPFLFTTNTVDANAGDHEKVSGEGSKLAMPSHPTGLLKF